MTNHLPKKLDSVLEKEFLPVAKSASVGSERPVAVRLLGIDLVLWRNDSGKVSAWHDLCIHRGAKLSLGAVRQGCLHCPYHGWVYDDTGTCVKFPAHPELTPPPRAHASTFLCREAYGWIWVSFAGENATIPTFPEWDVTGLRTFALGPYCVQAGGPRIIENFLDLAHLPILHSGILGDEKRPEIGRYEVSKTDDGLSATQISIWQPDPNGSGHGDMANYTYHVLRPLTAYLTKETEGARFTMMISASPVTELETEVYILISMAGLEQVSDASIIEWTERIFWQDVPVLESQKPELLPLDLQAELHLNSDRMSIAYRQWLGELGLTFGTS